jgi:hypothetical protein
VFGGVYSFFFVILGSLDVFREFIMSEPEDYEFDERRNLEILEDIQRGVKYFLDEIDFEGNDDPEYNVSQKFVADRLKEILYGKQ